MVDRRPCPICGQRPCQPTSDPETSNYLDGPGLIKWMELHGLPTAEEAFNGGRINLPFGKWRRGGSVLVKTVDKILSTTFLSLNDVPDCIWRKHPNNNKPKRSKPYSEKTKLAAVAEVKAGANFREVAKRVGCHDRSIQRWVDQHG